MITAKEIQEELKLSAENLVMEAREIAEHRRHQGHDVGGSVGEGAGGVVEETGSMSKETSIWTKDMLRGAAWAMQNIAIPLASERDAYRDALKELILAGSHEGECDNEYGEGPCSLHLLAAEERRKRAMDVLDRYSKTWDPSA